MFRSRSMGVEVRGYADHRRTAESADRQRNRCGCGDCDCRSDHCRRVEHTPATASPEPDAIRAEPARSRPVEDRVRRGDRIVKVPGQVVRMRSTVRTVQPDAAKALEQAWQRRRQELAGWQPANGWLLDQPLAR